MDKVKILVDSYMQRNTASKGGLIFVAVLLGILIAYILDRVIENVYKAIQNTVEIVPGTKSGKKGMVFDKAHLIQRSEDREPGIEFSYVFWMFLDGWDYKTNEWKHVLHKGNDFTINDPNHVLLQCPGIWLSKNTNKMHIVMNTFENPSITCDDSSDSNLRKCKHIVIDNLPVGKWFHVAITVRSKHVDTYINGEFIKRYVLASLPRQNYEPIHLQKSRGYGGFLSKLKYFNYAIDYSRIEDLVREGASKAPTADTGEMPPY